MIDEILIECNVASHHAGVKIARVEPTTSGGWQVSPMGKSRWEFTTIGREPNAAASTKTLGGATNRTHLGPTINRDVTSVRARCKLSCPQCKQSVAFTEETAMKVFETLRNADVATISLQAFGARVANS